MSHCNGHRWSKFWWRDHQGDAALRACSLAARGYWMELLCIAHEATPVGHVLLNGKRPTPRQMAAIAGCTEAQVKRLETELEEAGVFDKLHDGTIVCRRMVRDEQVSEAGRAHIAKRWKDTEKSENPISPPNGSPNRDPFSRREKKKIEEERKGSPAGNSRTQARATPRRTLPEDWQPNDTSIALAFAIGINLNEVQTEADKMRDWANHRGETGANWDARFNNWLRKEASDRQHRRRHTDNRTVQDLQKEWNLPSFLTPNFADDEPPLPAGFLLS
jgi:hypothetical protein